MMNYRIVVVVMLFLLTQSELIAQINKSVLSKKYTTVKDLNQLELEKIKTISIKPYISSDTFIKNDTLLKKQLLFRDTIQKTIKLSTEKTKTIKTELKSEKTDSQIIKNDSSRYKILIKKDTFYNVVKALKDTLPHIIIISDTIKNTPENLMLKSIELTVKERISKEDSILYISYLRNARFADSVRNGNKYWLDSTMSSLPKKKPVVMNDDDEIEIFVSGGGFYAGVNPKLYDRLTIYHSGLVHREFKTKLQGEQIEEKKLSKEELKKLAQFIIDMGFFDYNNVYDCNVNDVDCKTRLKSKPEPVALTVSVVIGARRKKIYLSFFAPKMESNYVNYPTSLEKIVKAIYGVFTQ